MDVISKNKRPTTECQLCYITECRFYKFINRIMRSFLFIGDPHDKVQVASISLIFPSVYGNKIIVDSCKTFRVHDSVLDS